jgi:ComF family protein
MQKERTLFLAKFDVPNLTRVIYLHDFFDLFFPNYCAGCGESLLRKEKTMCVGCLMQLPRTYMHDQRDNALEKLFWGRTDIQMATAFLRMPRHGLTHKLIHELKYNDNHEVGIMLGKLFGHELSNSNDMRQFDYIVPVPLHPKKKAERGYNQCDFIAEGLQEGMGVEMDISNLIRTQHTTTQTRKSRMSRWQNVESIFALRHPDTFANKRILLIDDVITTGSTLAACADVILQAGNVKLSVAALAMPVR